MKRILLSVFAVAITAAWAVPATAGDVTFGGQYRLRGEYTDNKTDFNDNAADDADMWVQRVRLTANANATDDTSVKITLQDTRQWGADNILTNSVVGTNTTLDLHEAYVNVNGIFGTPVAARVGRQELAYGSQRLIGSFGWSNNGRAFDGFKLTYANDGTTVDAFAMKPIDSGTTATDDALYGIYATLSQIVPDNTIDVYLLNNITNPTDRRYTIGARVAGAMAGVDYTLEVPYQFGKTGAADQDISAWAAAITAGYTLPTPTKIRIGAEYDYASGDDAGTASDNEAFNQLFPTNHGHFGISDIVNTWSNISAWSVNASAAVNEQLNLMVAYWNFTANETAVGASDKMGSEFDVVAKYKYNSNVGLEAGYSVFMPDDGNAAPPLPQDNADFAYLQLTANF